MKEFSASAGQPASCAHLLLVEQLHLVSMTLPLQLLLSPCCPWGQALVVAG
jgi:hypothetical protein